MTITLSKITRSIFFAVIAFALAVSAARISAATPTLYAPTPNSIPSAAFSALVNGMSVPVEKFGDVSYARFVITTPVSITVTAPGHKIRNVRISPLNSKWQPAKKGETFSFSIPQPGTYFVRVDNLEPLLIFADAPAASTPRPCEPRVIDLSTYLPASRDSSEPVTAAIQKAIDDTSALADGAGGILYVPNGRYVAAQLRLKSNVHLFLADGALLQSQTDFNQKDFPPQANGDSSFIFVENARNVRISGRGIIDGNGYAVRTLNAKANIKLLRTAGASDVLVEDVFFRDSARWSLHLLDSERVTFRGIKLVNDVRGRIDAKEKVHISVVTNTDGVDIDASRDVVVEDSFIYTADDAITPKVTNYMNRQGPCRGLVVRNNILWTIKCALKVGDETIEDLTDILFEKNYIIHADRVVALWSGDGGRIGDVRILNNMVESVGDDYNERFFMFRVRVRRPGISRAGIIDNILVKDFRALAPAPQPSSFEGLGNAGRISRVTFDNIVIGGKRARSVEDIPLRVKDSAEPPVFIKK